MNSPKKVKRQSKRKKSFVEAYRNNLIIAGVLIFAVVSSAFLMQSFAAKGGGKGRSSVDTGYSVKIVPNSSTTSNGGELTLGVYSSSLEEQVNAVSAVINYPSDKFEYISSDFTGSAFEIQADVSSTPGKLTIARGTLKPATGEQFIGKVVLKAVSTGRNISLTTDGSQLVSSLTNSYITTTPQKTRITISR